MNSSVTLDRDTSVMSSLCLEIRPSSRSNGPSKTSRCTSKAPTPRGASPASPAPKSPAPRSPVAVLTLTKVPWAGVAQPEPAQPEPCVLEVEQLGRGQVDGNLLPGVTARARP